MAAAKKTDSVPGAAARPGPKRPPGAAVGPEAVREVVLATAARLFGERGVRDVSLRDIAQAADVQLALIHRYIGRRDALIDEVFLRLSAELGASLTANPLAQQPYGRTSPMGCWVAVASYYSARRLPPPSDAVQPFRVLVTTFQQQFGISLEDARLRAAQIVAMSMGWRLFEDFLVTSTELDGLARQDVRDELTALQRAIGSMPRPAHE